MQRNRTRPNDKAASSYNNSADEKGVYLATVVPSENDEKNPEVAATKNAKRKAESRIESAKPTKIPRVGKSQPRPGLDPTLFGVMINEKAGSGRRPPSAIPPQLQSLVQDEPRQEDITRLTKDELIERVRSMEAELTKKDNELAAAISNIGSMQQYLDNIIQSAGNLFNVINPIYQDNVQDNTGPQLRKGS